MKILVVEDDLAVAQTLQLLLESCRYAVDITHNGIEGLQMAEAFVYDVLVLDIRLPELDGISFCHQFRSDGVQTPILLLTGQGSAGRQRAIALNAGADDYVSKPFDADEFIARFQALLRRGELTQQPVLTWGNLSIDPSRVKATYGSQLLTITPKEYAILELFLRNPPKALSAREVLDHVWTSLESPGEESVRVHIKELRRKLKVVGAPDDFIKTIHRVGYQLNSLYGTLPLRQFADQMTAAQAAELSAVNEELRNTLDQLRSAQAELRQKNQELEHAYEALKQERQQLQMARDELERQVAERTAELVTTNQALQQQQHQWQALFEHALDAIAITDDNGRYIDVNPAACELFGVSREEMLHSCVADFAAPETNMDQIWQQFLQQGQMSGVLRLHRRYGTTRYVEFNAIAHFIPGRHLSILRDISDRVKWDAERHQTEDALCQNQEMLNMALVSACAGSWLWDLVTGHVSWSPETFILYGISQTDGVLDYDVWKHAIHVDDRERVTTELQRVIEERQSRFQTEFRIIHPQKGVRWLLGVGRLTCNEQGEPIRISGINLDITDRKQLELALKASEAHLSQILHSAMAAIGEFCVYPDGTYTHQFMSAGCEIVYGYTQDEMMQASSLWESRIVPDDREKNFKTAFENITAENTFEIEYRFLDKENKIRWISERLISRWDEAASCWNVTTVATNITDRKHAEQALATSEERLRILVNALPFGVWVRDASDRLILQNSEDIARYGDIMGTCLEENNAPPEQIGRYKAVKQQCLNHGVVQYESTETIHEETRTFLRINAPLPDTDGGTGIFGAAIDITDRKQAEQELIQTQKIIRQQLAEIETIYQSAPIGLSVLDRDFRFVRINERLAEINGLPVEAHIGRTVRELLPDIADTTEQILTSIFETGEPRFHVLIHGETPAQPSVKRTLLEHFLPLKDGDHVIGINIVCEEVTERVHAENQLRESEERFRSLNAAAPIAICQATSEGLCVYNNDYWQELSGLSFEESLGTGWLTAVHPDDREMLANAWNAYLETNEEFSLEFRLLTPDGKTLWIATRAAAMYSSDGEIIGYVSIGIDITERKQSKQALQESQQRLRTILDNTPAAIYLIDAQNNYLFANRSCVEQNETTLENLIGKSLYDVWPVDIADTFASGNRTVLETGKLLQLEEVVPLPDGEHTYITAKFPLYDVTGNPYAICGISTDITEQKHLEAQCYHAQRFESLGTLASGIAHDLNNVFTPILAMAQLLRLTQSNQDPSVQERLQLIESSARRGADMVHQILTFTRGETGTKSPVDLAPLLQEIANIIHQSFPKSISICQEINRPLGIVLANETYLHQVFMNLCVNARDAMPNGGILTLTAKTIIVDVDVAATLCPDAQVGHYVLVTIADTGTGIAPDVRDRIFDPFFTTKPAGEGSGLGLSTALGIVKSYGGFLNVVTTVGQGTHIQVYLPVAIAPPCTCASNNCTNNCVSINHAPSAPIISAAPILEHPSVVPFEPRLRRRRQPTSGASGQILVIDDDEVVQYSTQALLEDHLYPTLIANDGIEAIALYTQYQHCIQVVVLDIMMPKMDGFELIRQLKAINPMVKIIAASGLPSNREAALRAGASMFLAKPYPLEDLLRNIECLLLS